MSQQDLLNASKNGDLESVINLLASKQIDINCTDIFN